jgi:hypothetical protein
VSKRSSWLALIAGAALALALSATVLAYAAQVVAALTVSGPGGSASCGTPITLRATALETGGAPIEGQPIDWAFTSSPSNQDRINSTPTITNASGVASTTVTLACVVGDRTVTATGDAVNASAVLGVTSAGLPGTSTGIDVGPLGKLPLATIAAILAVLAGSGIILRRFVVGLR